MKKFLLPLLICASTLFSQPPPQPFFLQQLFNLSWYDWAFNLEGADINRDGRIDMVLGNANETRVFYGGPGTLDTAADVKYKGRCLAVCDYNGDGLKDLITMEFVSLDTATGFWTTNLLFYYGSDTSQIAIDTTADYTVPFPKLNRSDDYIGSRYVRYGDFNGDGKSDIVISSPGYRGTESREGIIYIYIGSEIPPNTPNYIVEGRKTVLGEQYFGLFGLYFQVGNINNDEFDDLLISETQQTTGIPRSDSLAILYVYYGKENFIFYADSESIKYESPYLTGWFQQVFSIADINDDGISDLIIGGGKSTKIHYGSSNGIDTIPSFIFADQDTNRHDFGGNSILFNIGDFNKDGYNDFIAQAIDFTLHLGGPYLSNYNPYGITGLAGIYGYPDKAIPVGDQNGDSVNDFAVCKLTYLTGIDEWYGYLVIYAGRNDIHTDVKDKPASIVKQFELYQNYPNPFNPTTTIEYEIPAQGLVEIKIFDIQGRLIRSFERSQQQAGNHKLIWDGRNDNGIISSSGIYFCRVDFNGKLLTKKLALIK